MWETFSILISCYFFLFILSIILKDNSIADVFWGLGFIIISFSLFYFESSQSLLHTWVLILIMLWGMRLFSLFFLRKMKKKWEDPRYAGWRDTWKYFYSRSFFQVYLLQMLLMCLVSVPLFYIFTNEGLHPIFTATWATIAILGWAYEIVADKQIVEFLKKKKKEENIVYTWGLWKYSRNPNYFWESIFWLGISIISIPISIFWILWYFVITFLLLYVSWVPMKEVRQKKKSNWSEYAQITPKFIPWFSKK